MKKTMIATASILMLALAAPVLASSDDKDSKSYSAGSVEWMSVDSARAKAAELGYDVRKVERDDDYYEIDAFDSNGMKVEIEMHPATGQILKVERDDDDQR